MSPAGWPMRRTGEAEEGQGAGARRRRRRRPASSRESSGNGQCALLPRLQGGRRSRSLLRPGARGEHDGRSSLPSSPSGRGTGAQPAKKGERRERTHLHAKKTRTHSDPQKRRERVFSKVFTLSQVLEGKAVLRAGPVPWRTIVLPQQFPVVGRANTSCRAP